MTDGPSLDGTRLSPQDYLALMDSDLEAMVAACTDLEAQVPGCPDWSVRDLVSHVVGVYRHKVVALDTGAPPPQQEQGWGHLEPGEDPLVALRTAYADLRDRLAGADAGAPSWTWWPAEQTVGFWQRRMAQETAVHRWDAQSARDGVAGAEPVDDRLAADGVDELLGWLTWPWEEEQPGASGQQVLVSTADHAWTVSLHPARVEVRGSSAAGDKAGADAVALLAGEPSGLLLHLWGRPGEHGVATGGDPVALRLLLDRLAQATS